MSMFCIRFESCYSYLLGETEQYDDVGVEDDPTDANDHKVHGAQQEHLQVSTFESSCK